MREQRPRRAGEISGEINLSIVCRGSCVLKKKKKNKGFKGGRPGAISPPSQMRKRTGNPAEHGQGARLAPRAGLHSRSAPRPLRGRPSARPNHLPGRGRLAPTSHIKCLAFISAFRSRLQLPADAQVAGPDSSPPGRSAREIVRHDRS